VIIAKMGFCIQVTSEPLVIDYRNRLIDSRAMLYPLSRFRASNPAHDIRWNRSASVVKGGGRSVSVPL
jgi:hypothetical protein